MDPISIIGTALALATTVTQVSSSLYSFIKAAKHVEDTVRNLHAELDGLQEIVLSFSAALKHPALASLGTSADRDQKKTWSSIHRALRNCGTSIDGMSRNLVSVQRKSRPGGKVVKQIRLNLVDADLKDFRAQSQSHVAHLSVALQSINLYGPR